MPDIMPVSKGDSNLFVVVSVVFCRKTVPCQTRECLCSCLMLLDDDDFGLFVCSLLDCERPLVNL